MFVVETKRLYLRHFNNEDIAALHAIFSDAETMKYYPAPFNLIQTKNWVDKNIDRYEKDGFGLWGVCLKETNELIGDCGLVKQIVDGKNEVEIGYHINKNYWSRGFATEAANGCMEYGTVQLGLHRLISIIDPFNRPSIRVAEKNGFTKEKESFIFNKIHSIYSLTKR
ncbi:GNAT family N-acetyltransferase [Lysinibacillus sp. NPDC097195]|uniref:GNAT family N-acetyltransferase n=1 Tax=Lysinibacillus sp. NPDC097195 TaxID=3364141 RepID=UPI003821F1EE